MTKLTDTQAILLTTAAIRQNGMLLPVPDTITAPTERVRKAIISLVARGLAAEKEVPLPSHGLRSDGDNHVGAVITDAGRAAIGVIDVKDEKPPLEQPVAPPPKRETKAAAVLALLQRTEGATLAELISATGWLPHTTRAALTGIREKGHTIEKAKRGEETCYRIVAAA